MLRILRSPALLVALASCGGDGGSAGGAASYALVSVVIDPDGGRTTYVQTIASLDDGPFDNRRAIELPGNGVVLAHGRSFYVGAAEAPTWTRYTVGEDGALAETGTLSLASTGATAMDFGNVIVDADTAVSVFGDQGLAMVWNPTTLEITAEIDLSSLARDGYAIESWTTTTHGGKVYIPARYADWEGSRILPVASLTILDPEAGTFVTAEDDRCASSGRPVFTADGTAYVMGDGRNFIQQMFAIEAGEAVPKNCLLRLAPGATDFDPDYFVEIPSLTGGLESITELETAQQGSGIGFAKMFYPDQLPDGVVVASDYAFWNVPAFKMWRIQLGDTPTAEEVEGLPFSAIGFGGSVVDGKLYTGESPSPDTTVVYETDPATRTAVERFSMDGYFNGLYRLE